MTAVSWRDGAAELRRLVGAEGGGSDGVPEVAGAWRGFRGFLGVPLRGLFDGWDDGEIAADTLVIEFGVDGRSELVFARRFAVPSVDDGDDDADSEADDAGARSVQIEIRLGFADSVGDGVEGVWTAERSGRFDPADLDEATDLVRGLGLGRPLRSRVALVDCG